MIVYIFNDSGEPVSDVKTGKQLFDAIFVVPLVIDVFSQFNSILSTKRDKEDFFSQKLTLRQD